MTSKKAHTAHPVKKGTARAKAPKKAASKAPAPLEKSDIPEEFIETPGPPAFTGAPTAVVAAAPIGGDTVVQELKAGDSATVSSSGAVTFIPEGHMVVESGEVVPDPSKRSYAG